MQSRKNFNKVLRVEESFGYEIASGVNVFLPFGIVSSEIFQVQTMDFRKVPQVGCWCSKGYIEDWYPIERLKQFNHIQYRVSNTNMIQVHDMQFLQEQIPPLLPPNIYTIGCWMQELRMVSRTIAVRAMHRAILLSKLGTSLTKFRTIPCLC